MANVKIRDAFGQATLYSDVNKVALLDENGNWHEFGGIFPSGNINITTTSAVDVYSYATAIVSDANLLSENIKLGTTILGVQGTFAGGGATAGLINRTLSEITESEIVQAGSFGPYAFAYCESLTSMPIPSSFNLSSVPIGCFEQCANISVWSLPSGIEWVEDAAFNGCAGLSSIDLTACRIIAHAAFMQTGLTRIELPACENMGSNAFAMCRQLSEISLAENTYVDEYAFASCYSLISVYIPDGCTLRCGVFSDCGNLSQISFGADVTITNATDMFAGTDMRLVDFSSVYFGDFITPIEDFTRTFFDCRQLSSVRFGYLQSSAILTNTFFYCLSLHTIMIDDTDGVPPVNTLTFALVPYSCQIFVPSSWVASFQAASIWSMYDIQPII